MIQFDKIEIKCYQLIFIIIIIIIKKKKTEEKRRIKLPNYILLFQALR